MNRHLLLGCMLSGFIGMFSAFCINHYYYHNSISSNDVRNNKVKEKRLMKRKVNEQRGKTYPPFVPNGWYKLCFSTEVKRGAVLQVEALGKLYAVFRGENDGKVGVLDAYCPHLGANMASHGCVVGDTLECPFHQWRFEKDGAVACIPYFKDAPPQNANAISYNSREMYGQIFVWYDAEGAPPSWELPHVAEIDNGEMLLYGGGSHLRKDIYMHIQEFAENGVDFAHFAVLHSKLHVPWFPQFVIPFVNVIHKTDYELDEKNKHMSYFSDNVHLKVFGKDLDFTKGKATVHFIGSGGCVQFWFELPNVGKIVLFETHTPIEPCVLSVDYLWYAEKHIPSALVSYVVGNWYSQAANDFDIWENKIYLDKPVILKTDGPVNTFRRWYRQFYSKSYFAAKKEQQNQQQQQQNQNQNHHHQQQQQQCDVSKKYEY